MKADLEQSEREALIELTARIAQRDETALGALYDVSVSRVYGLALRITRQREAAEEVTEDVYMQVWEQADRFDANRGGVWAWLLTICRSRALDSLRRKDEAEPHPEPEALMAEPIDSKANPEDILLAVESNHRLHAVLAGLSAVQRQLLTLAFFRGLSHREIADHVAMPLGTVKTHLRKAMETMRVDLARHYSITE